MSTTASLERLYRQFSVYPRPTEVLVCEQCAPPNTAARDVLATPLRSLSLPQLHAVHVMSLDDDALRYYLPRLVELMLNTSSPVFDFRLSELKQRIPAWQSAEVSALRQLAEAVWAQLSTTYPVALGYFSDCSSALDLLDWCGLSLTMHLDSLLEGDAVPAARHLADLVDALFTNRDPFETASRPKVLDWVRNPAVGERLQAGFFAADTDDAAQQLSAAHELWTTCAS